MRVGPFDSIVNIDEVRRAFDASFTAPEKNVLETHERMLAIRVGDARFAIRVSEIAGVEMTRKIVPLPHPLPGLLGIAGVRRHVVAVYALATLLDTRRTDTPARWLVLAANENASIAFAFDALDGFFEVAHSRIHPVDRATENEYVHGMVAENEMLWPLLHIPTLTAHALGIARRELRGTEKR